MARKISRRSSNDLTARQGNILDFIIEFFDKHTYAPSIREIGIFFKIKSTNGVSDHLRALERKGYIKRDALRGRGIRILKTPDGTTRMAYVSDEAGTVESHAIESHGGAESDGGDHGGRDPGYASEASRAGHRSQMDRGQHLSVPMLGAVAAGKPILAVELAEQQLSLDKALLPSTGPGTFALRVQGRSMIDAGILPEDLIFVQPQPHADNGTIVVAMIDGEATVKRYYDEGDRVRLQPENREMAPIWVDKSSDLQLLGRVVGVWRGLD